MNSYSDYQNQIKKKDEYSFIDSKIKKICEIYKISNDSVIGLVYYKLINLDIKLKEYNIELIIIIIIIIINNKKKIFKDYKEMENINLEIWEYLYNTNFKLMSKIINIINNDIFYIIFITYITKIMENNLITLFDIL